MKNKFLLIIITILVSSCSDLTELNQNPGTSTNMNPELLIPSIQLQYSSNQQNMNRNLVYPGGFMNHWTAENATVVYGGYGAKHFTYLSRIWEYTYPYNVKNVVDLIARTAGVPEMINLNSMGRILKVEVFLQITDAYGDVPYTEAGKGYLEGIVEPKYDKQEDIYIDFIKELKEAELSLDDALPTVADDLYFQGDIAKWKRFANSLRLRIAMRLIKVAPALAQAEAEAAVVSGVMKDNGDIAFVKHDVYLNPDTGHGSGNGYAQIFGTKGTWRMSDLFVNALGAGEVITEDQADAKPPQIPTVEDKDLIDPRIYWIGGAYANDKDRTDLTGAILAKDNRLFGITAQQTLSKTNYLPKDLVYSVVKDNKEVAIPIEYKYMYMQPSKLVTNLGAPYIHLSYAETQFYMAEMAIRGWVVGASANDLYKKGLEAAIAQWSLFGAEVDESATAINTVVLAKTTAFNEKSDVDKMDEVATQMWLSTCIDPMETWSYFRRLHGGNMELTNYFKITNFFNNDPTTNTTGGKTPRRLQYPLDEPLKNEENNAAAVARLSGSGDAGLNGVDDWQNKVWWDK